LGYPTGPILRVQESKRKPVVPIQSSHREECGWCKVSVVYCQTAGFRQVFGVKGSVIVSAALERDALR